MIDARPVGLGHHCRSGEPERCGTAMDGLATFMRTTTPRVAQAPLALVRLLLGGAAEGLRQALREAAAVRTAEAGVRMHQLACRRGISPSSRSCAGWYVPLRSVGTTAAPVRSRPARRPAKYSLVVGDLPCRESEYRPEP